MTVAQLLAELAKMPLDSEVVTEGCDCEGDASGCTLITEVPSYTIGAPRIKLDRPYVLITRSN